MDHSPKNSYQRNETDISIIFADPYMRTGSTTLTIGFSNRISNNDLQILVSAWLRTIAGQPIPTIRTSSIGLKAAISFVEKKSLTLQSCENWQTWVCDFFEFFLTDMSYSEASLKTRMNSWSNCSSLLSTLQLDGIIPNSVIIPRAKINSGIYSATSESKNYVVGESITDPSEFETRDSPAYCVDITYALDSHDFFEKLESTITARIKIIQDGARAYWKNVKNYHELGKTIISEVSDQEFLAQVEVGHYLCETEAGETKHLINTDRGMAWLLKYLTHILTGTNPLSLNISFRDIARSSFFANINVSENRIYQILEQKIDEVRPQDVLLDISRQEFLAKLLGLLHARDCSCIATLLISEHPGLTPMSIVNADITSSRGKYFLYGANKNKRQILSSSKPRAGKRVNAILTENSLSLIHDVLEATKKIRIGLKSSGLAHRRLFLTGTQNGFGAATNVIGLMNCPLQLSLYEIISRYVEVSFPKDTISLGKIRNSLGLIAWLKKGSVEAMANCLCNTPAVVLRSYLPAWLIRKWNERTIRRYQQVLILLAAYKSPWLLEASDFKDEKQLLQFVRSVVDESKSGDPLGDLIESRLGPITGAAPREISQGMLLKLSANSLYAIYSFTEDETNLKNSSEPESAICSLSYLIRDVFDHTDLSTVDSAIRTKIQGDSFTDFKKMHFEALAMLQNKTRIN